MSVISRLKILVLKLCMAGMLLSCANDKGEVLSIEAKPVDGQIEGDILTGSSVLNDPIRFIWGGSVIKGDDNRYHMLYATWECGDAIPQFSDSWVLHSKIAYAVSDYPDRGYKFQKIILQGRALSGDSTAWDAQMVHNPHIRKFNEKYYLYYGGGKDPGPQPEGSKGERLNKRNRVQQSQKIGVIEFNSFEELLSGHFIRLDAPLLSPRTRVKPDNIVDPSPEGTKPKPDNIIVVNPKNGRAHFFDIKTSQGSRIVNGKSVGGSGNKLKPNQKELGVRLCLVEGEEIRIVEKRETITKRQKKENGNPFRKARKGINFLEEC